MPYFSVISKPFCLHDINLYCDAIKTNSTGPVSLQLTVANITDGEVGDKLQSWRQQVSDITGKLVSRKLAYKLKFRENSFA